MLCVRCSMAASNGMRYSATARDARYHTMGIQTPTERVGLFDGDRSGIPGGRATGWSHRAPRPRFERGRFRSRLRRNAHLGCTDFMLSKGNFGETETLVVARDAKAVGRGDVEGCGDLRKLHIGRIRRPSRWFNRSVPCEVGDAL